MLKYSLLFFLSCATPQGGRERERYQTQYNLFAPRRSRTTTRGPTHLITVMSGVVQTALYVDFFYHYVTAKLLGKSSIELPQA